jgi:hypothetical protein
VGIDEVANYLAMMGHEGIKVFNAEGIGDAHVIRETPNVEECDHASCNGSVYVPYNVDIHVVVNMMLELLGEVFAVRIENAGIERVTLGNGDLRNLGASQSRAKL